MDDLVNAVAKIEINDGDLLVIKYDGDIYPVRNFADDLIGLLEHMGKSRCGIVFLPPGMELSSFSESEMEELGWYKL